jgi:hypothetical protein
VRFPTYHGAYRSSLPGWAVTLGQELPRGGNQADRASPGIVTALTDLRIAALAAGAGRAMRASTDRESIRDDLKRAFADVGPSLGAAIGPVIEQLREDLGQIPALMADASSAPIVRASAEAVLEALQAPGFASAAWIDARESFEKNKSASIRELRVRQLAELVELRGVDWASIAKRTRGCLFGDRSALAEIGAVEEPADAELWAVPVDLSVDECLAHAHTAILSEPDAGEIVAWVCFAPAALRIPHAKIGVVELFSHELWPAAVIGEDTEAGVDPYPEFEDDFYTHLFVEMPEEPYVLVRLPLGHREVAGAAERARAIASDLMRVARPRSRWKLIDGTPVFLFGDHSGWFGKPFGGRAIEREAVYGRLRAPSDISGELLRQVAEEAVTGLISDQPAIINAVRDIEWWEAVTSVPDPTQQLALGIRLVERLLPQPPNGGWVSACERYLRRIWQDQMSLSLIADIAESAIEILEGPLPTAGGPNPWRDRLYAQTGPLGYQLDLRETLLAIPDLLDELEPMHDSMQRAYIQELGHFIEKPHEWLKYLERLGKQFDTLVRRAARQRNAIVHGADTEPTMVKSVGPFVEWVEAVVVSRQLSAAVRGEDFLARLEHENAVIRGYMQGLSARKAIVHTIFANYEDAPADGHLEPL